MQPNPYWDQYAKQPVLIKQGAQTLKFVSFKDGMLNAELEGGIGEISLPVSQSMAQSLQLQLDIESAKQIIAGGNLEEGLKLLRTKVYPLIKFHQLPAAFLQLHIPIQGLLNTLILAGEDGELDDLFQRIQLDQSDIAYSEIAIRFMDARITKGEYEEAAKMTQSLPLDGQYKVNISAVVKIADDLRAAGHYQAVIPIYREIQHLLPDAIRENVELWIAYSLVLAGELEEAQPLIEKMKEPAMEDRLFSLYQTLHGTLAHRNEDYSQALDLLTRGFVCAQSSYPWVPEMLYLIGECYRIKEDPKAARNVWTELTRLYPESPAALRGSAALKKLPAPQTAEI